MHLIAGSEICNWQVTPLIEEEFNVEVRPMKGEMDSTFFLTKDKNFIPHTYPCREEYIALVRDKEPIVPEFPSWADARNVLPQGSNSLDLSGFWFRATRISGWARTAIEASEAGECRLSVSICGAAKVFVNGNPATWLAPATRNASAEEEFSASLRAGINEVLIWFEDLAERDAMIHVRLKWLAGPRAKQGNTFDVDPALLKNLNDVLNAMHLNRPHYDCESIILVLPCQFSRPAELDVSAGGHFMARHTSNVIQEVAPGQSEVILFDSIDLPNDFRYFDVTISCEGFVVSGRLAAEVSNHSCLPRPSTNLSDRVDETLAWIAENGEDNSEVALACLAVGGVKELLKAEQIIDFELDAIERCNDCADFLLVPLIWAQTKYQQKMADPQSYRLQQAILNYRYWMDEPGNDVQWYFSENHALLFHTAAYLAGNINQDQVFVRSGRSGAEQMAVGRARLLEWFDHFEQAEMAEFNSAPYFPIDLKGLLSLSVLAPDDDIRQRANAAIRRLVTLIARSSFCGVMTAAQGRSYEHSLLSVMTSEISGISRLLWAKGGFGAHVECLAQFALALNEGSLSLPDLENQFAVGENLAQEWNYWQGQNAFCKLTHYKTKELALGSASNYRWFEWGYQETLVHGRFGQNPRAQVWINHPGELVQSGYGRPSYWGGSASVPRVQQYRDLAIVFFNGVEDQVPFTHAWFPTTEFDEWKIEQNGAFARSGGGCLSLWCSSELHLIEQGPSAYHELRAVGKNSIWVLRLSNLSEKLCDTALETPVVENSNNGPLIKVQDAEYGRVEFHPTGIISAERRMIDPANWTLEGTREVFPIARLKLPDGLGNADA